MRKRYELAIRIDEYSYFHCIANATRKHHQSDVVSFDDCDKDYLLGLLHRLEKLYAGIEVLQYCLMGTHTSGFGCQQQTRNKQKRGPGTL